MAKKSENIGDKLSVLRKKRKPPAEKRISLRPLGFKEAVKGLFETKRDSDEDKRSDS